MINVFKKLMEGGNVFKDTNKEPLTQRIAKDEIKPSVAFVEKILGMPLNGYLGTTGKKESSGDIDISVDNSKYDKKEVANKLRAWAKSQGLKPADWVKLSGSNVHFKTPIRNAAGKHIGGYAQLDLMFGNPKFQKWSMRGEPGKYKGVHRHILMANIAKANGMKWSYLNGLVDRNTNEIISQDPDTIVRKLLPGATVKDFNSVESILNYVYNHIPENQIERYVGEAYETLKQHYGVTLPVPNDGNIHESNDTDQYFLARLRDRIVVQDCSILLHENTIVEEIILTEGPRINHLEDLVMFEGPKGLLKSIEILRKFAEGDAHSQTTLKWDGCIAGDSILVTNKGDLPISKVIDDYKNIKVLSHNFDTDVDEYVDVKMAGKQNGTKNWIEITLENDKVIKMTEDHEVYTTNRGWVQAKDLTNEDDIKESSIK